MQITFLYDDGRLASFLVQKTSSSSYDEASGVSLQSDGEFDHAAQLVIQFLLMTVLEEHLRNTIKHSSQSATERNPINSNSGLPNFISRYHRFFQNLFGNLGSRLQHSCWPEQQNFVFLDEFLKSGSVGKSMFPDVTHFRDARILQLADNFVAVHPVRNFVVVGFDTTETLLADEKYSDQ